MSDLVINWAYNFSKNISKFFLSEVVASNFLIILKDFESKHSPVILYEISLKTKLLIRSSVIGYLVFGHCISSYNSVDPLTVPPTYLKPISGFISA